VHIAGRLAEQEWTDKESGEVRKTMRLNADDLSVAVSSGGSEIQAQRRKWVLDANSPLSAAFISAHAQFLSICCCESRADDVQHLFGWAECRVKRQNLKCAKG
jgi:hypothetical protein